MELRRILLLGVALATLIVMVTGVQAANQAFIAAHKGLIRIGD